MKSLKNVNNLVDSLSTYFSVVSKNRVTGEKASGMKTKAFDFKLKKVRFAFLEKPGTLGPRS